MNEDFLHYLWKNSLFTEPFPDLNGEIIKVISPGEHNTDQGPDFLNAKIKIGNTLWVGNVEFHLKASDWRKHKHHTDSGYNNVILHVVADNDEVVYYATGKAVPTIELSTNKELHHQYLFLMQTKQWVPCESFIHKVDEINILQWKEALMVERMEQKSVVFLERYKFTNNDWEETFYLSLAHNFGFKTNALPFEMLAKSLPLRIIQKHRDQLIHVEAMLFGQSGLIPSTEDISYVEDLQKNYHHFKTKFSLIPLEKHLWKFMRLRPANFPTLRIAQFADLLTGNSHLFSKVIEINTLDEARNLLNVKASAFWDTHYNFEKESPTRMKNLGKSAADNLIINTLVPLLFVYGKQKGDQFQINKAFDWLAQIPPEKNRITTKWDEMGISIDSAFDSQALIQLKNVYCTYRKCLQCRIGNQVIKHTI